MATETYHYGIRDVKIARWLAEDSYGPEIDVDAAREFTVTIVTQSDQLEGDDVIKDTYSKPTSATATVSNGSVNHEVLAVVSGGTYVYNDDYEDVKIGEDDNSPYFALAGRIVGSNAADEHILLPKCKASGQGISYEARLNSYLIPSLQVTAVSEGEINGIARFRKFSEVTPLSIPLATAAG
jgi:hypothetical protein